MIYELLEKYKVGQYLDRRLVLLADMTMVALASTFSMLFVSVLSFYQFTFKEATLWMCSSILFSFMSFFFLGSYKSIVRNSSLYEAWTLLRAVLTRSVMMLVVLKFACFYYKIEFNHFFALLLLDTVASYLALMLDRVVVVAAYDIVRQQNRKRRAAATIMVYGVHEDSYNFVQANKQDFNIVGYLRRGKSRRKYRLGEHRVYEFNDTTRLMQILDMNLVDTIVYTNQADVNKEESMLILCCREQKIKTLFAPTIKELGDEGKSVPTRPREMSIEDLLERPEVKISMGSIKHFLQNKVIIVTGAAGSIGSELCRLLANFGVRRIVLFDSAETPMHNLRLELEDCYPNLDFMPVIGDVRFSEKLDRAFSQYRPDIVFHAAAYKHVPLMEGNPLEAVHTNVIGSRNVADMCLKYDVSKMVMISTDKAVNPTNVMGCTKRIAEIYVQSLADAVAKGELKGNTQFVTTRFGNVLGSNGSVIPRFREQIAKGGPVTVTHPEITRFFMTIPEACRLVMEAAAMDVENRILVFDMGARVKIAHLAERMIELAGYTPGKEIKIEYTGLRPGEKLYEEVRACEEDTIPTSNSSIRIAKAREYDYGSVLEGIHRLESLCMKGDIASVVKEMKRMVPEYRSQNSEYERYDVQQASDKEKEG